MRHVHRLGSGLCIAGLALAVLLLGGRAAWSDEVRGQDAGTHGQLEFEWDTAIEYRMRRNGNRVIVVFDRRIGDGASQAFRRVGSYLEEGRIIGDGSTILLILQPTMSLVERRDDSTVVFELRPSSDEPPPDVAAAPEPQSDPQPIPRPEPVPEAAPAAAVVHAAPPTAPTPAPAPIPPAAPDRSAESQPQPTPVPTDRPTIRVRGGEHADYSRIVFDWTGPVGYRVEQSGGEIRIVFDAPGDADFARAAPAGLSRVDSLSQIGNFGGLAVSVAVPSDSRLRHFRTGPKVVLDILEGDGTPAPVQAAEQRLAPTQEPMAELTPEPMPAGASPPTPESAPPQIAEQPVVSPRPTAVAGREPAARIPHASTGHEAEGAHPDPDMDHASPSGAEAAEPHQIAEAPSDGSMPEREVGQPMSLLPLRAPERTPVEIRPLQTGPVDPIARFDPGVPAALAVFERGRSLWVVFASESNLDANVLASQGSPALGSVDVVRAEGGIALRFQLDQQGDIVVSRRGTRWTVALEPAAIRSAETLDLVPQPDYPLGPRLLIEGGTGPGLVRFTDPLVGDVLIAAPIVEPAVGLMEDARLAQVRLLPSVQGLVARPMSESLAMRVARDGIEITDADGLLLSPSEDTTRKVIAIAPPVDVEGRLLEIDVWRGVPGDGFIEQRQAIQKTLAQVDEVDLDRARLDFARFNFAHGYAEETLGLLDLVEESQPSIAGRESFVILRGAARVLADELEAAVADLNHPGLAESRDAALWRAVAAAKSEDWSHAAIEFEKAGRLIETYPRPFADLLVRLAARTAIEMNDPQGAEAQLTRLSALTAGESDEWASTNYLRGVMADKAGDVATASTAFEAAAGSDDRYYRTLSELALVEIDLAEGDIEWEEAVATLESLRFAWRGDQIEFDLIDRIESLYWQEGRFRMALETLQQAGRSFPGELAGEVYEARLQARFVELFGSDRITSMSPLAAISLYHDYAALMPDDDDGDRVLRGLAERLVEIDLLDQAGDILAELLDTRLEELELARTGTRLAGIRLLSGQPEAAIQALDASEAEAGALPALADERRLLRAHALSELGESSAALGLLASDRTPIAAAARADIAWRAGDWPVAAEAMGELVKPPPPAGTPISDAESELVLNLGIALALANDVAGLNRLEERYGAAMARSASANTFAILTRSPGGTPQIADLAAIRQQVSEVDLFQQFLAGYRTAPGPRG